MVNFKRVIAATALAGLMLASPTPVSAAKKYPNCTALTRDYPNGVAKNRASTVGLDYKPRVRKAVYAANSGLDRDKDGVACERG